VVEWSALLNGVAALISWQIMYVLLSGVFFGVLCGAIPGFTACMAVAVLLPVTYGMSPLVGMTLLVSTYAGAIYGGSITAILLNCPGTPAAACTAFDGYEMTKQGKHNEALGLAIGSSVVGGSISYFFLLVLMYPIAAFAIKFGSPEMFILAILGLTIIASIGKGNFAKSILAGLFGLLISTVGISPTGAIRANFGLVGLMDGVPIVPAIIGFLAFSELFSMLHTEFIVEGGDNSTKKKNIFTIIKYSFYCFKYPMTLIKSILIGTFIGAVPAAGASVASFVSYNQAKQSSKNGDNFGKGEMEGIVASESANNASTGGALCTMLAIGIPGSGTTAILLGALMLHGLQPGPRLFMFQMELVYGIIIALFLSQIILFIAGVTFSYYLSGIVNISTKILVPTIALLSIVGSFALQNSIFDAQLMFVFGLIGWVMKKNDYPVIAAVLGIILGPIADSNLIRTAIRYRNDFTVFFTRPVSLVLIIFIVLSMVLPIIVKKIDIKKQKKT